RMDDLRPGEGVLQVGATHERRGKGPVQCSAEPPAANRQEEEAHALVTELDRPRRGHVHVEGNTRPPPRRSKTYEGHVVMAFRERSRQRARLRLGASDRR